MSEKGTSKGAEGTKTIARPKDACRARTLTQTDKKKEIVLKECSIMPIMVVSINTLYLYDTLLVKKGLCNVIDAFVRDYARYDSTTGRYNIAALADFDAYLRRNAYKKSGDAVRWLKRIMKQGKIVVGNEKDILMKGNRI